MKRDEWKFPHTADVLADAAQKKATHHAERLRWWEGKKTESMDAIRAEGLEIDESLVEESMKLSNYNRAPTVSIRNDLMRDLNECVAKIKEHRDKEKAYSGWQKVLASQGKATLDLEHDDWLYFFAY